MAGLKPKSFWMRPADVDRRWHHMDADGQTLGKLATKAARALMGKLSPKYTPGVDMGDFVVVTNADKVRVTGTKSDQKVYRYHTGYVGGLKETTYKTMKEKGSKRIIELAVRRMLPKTTLGRKCLKRLKVYDDSEHPHVAQGPKPLKP